MDKIDFEIIDDKLIRYIPVFEAGNNICRSDTVIDKDTFIKCYEKWIKGEGKDWLQTFNTDSATACYTAVQRLKESLNADSD